MIIENSRAAPRPKKNGRNLGDNISQGSVRDLYGLKSKYHLYKPKYFFPGTPSITLVSQPSEDFFLIVYYIKLYSARIIYFNSEYVITLKHFTFCQSQLKKHWINYHEAAALHYFKSRVFHSPTSSLTSSFCWSFEESQPGVPLSSIPWPGAPTFCASF